MPIQWSGGLFSFLAQILSVAVPRGGIMSVIFIGIFLLVLGLATDLFVSHKESMMNKTKQLADLVRQERDAVTVLNNHQDAAQAREEADKEKEAQLYARISTIAAQKEALLDDLADDDFEAVTVE